MIYYQPTQFIWKSRLMQIKKHPRFEKEFKRLMRKYPSLESDFSDFEKVLIISPQDNILIEWLGENVLGEFYKVKKFRCQSIARQSQNSWIRIIYNYLESDNLIVLTYIEIFHKNQKENHPKTKLCTTLLVLSLFKMENIFWLIVPSRRFDLLGLHDMWMNEKTLNKPCSERWRKKAVCRWWNTNCCLKKSWIGIGAAKAFKSIIEISMNAKCKVKWNKILQKQSRLGDIHQKKSKIWNSSRCGSIGLRNLRLCKILFFEKICTWALDLRTKTGLEKKFLFILLFLWIFFVKLYRGKRYWF